MNKKPIKRTNVREPNEQINKTKEITRCTCGVKEVAEKKQIQSVPRVGSGVRGRKINTTRVGEMANLGKEMLYA